MEEDIGGVRVTRLRRRLSVEQNEDSKSPTAPSTPSKKRGGRLAAKPLLDNIDENAPVSSPRRITRKSISRDTLEPAEEKSVTPSRRNTRIKSNTSIVLETTQNFESPRAKRAARRNSVAGSDTEGPATPSRQTRRTRKDSSSSVENQGDTFSATRGKGITNNIILEEASENSSSSAVTSAAGDISNTSPSSIRKSPRLKAKTVLESNDTENVKEITKQNNIPHNENISNSPSRNLLKEKSTALIIIDTETVEQDKTITPKNIADPLSQGINTLEKKNPSKKISVDKNNSTSEIDNINSSNVKQLHTRHRTKSLTNLNKGLQTDTNFFSDSESNKKKTKKLLIANNISSKITGVNADLDECKIVLKDILLKDEIDNNLSKDEKSLKRHLDSSISIHPSSKFTGILTHKDNDCTKVQELLSLETNNILNNTSKGKIQSIIYLEDSDSNSTDKVSRNKNYDIGDQCVPVVNSSIKYAEVACNDKKSLCINITNVTPSKQSNQSCEPMDIDETIPENVSLLDSSNNKILDNSNSKNINNIVNKNTSLQKKRNSLKNNIDSSSNNKNCGFQNESNDDTNNLNVQTRRNSSQNENSDKSNESSKTLNLSNTKKQKQRKSSTQNTDNSYSKDMDILSKDDKMENIVSNVNNSFTYNSKNTDKFRKSLPKNSSSHVYLELENTGQENKSTLILSEIKDISARDENSRTSKTKITKTIKTVNENQLDNKNLSLNNDDNTPLKHTNVQKLGIHTSTPNTGEKIFGKKALNKNNTLGNTSDNESSEESKDVDHLSGNESSGDSKDIDQLSDNESSEDSKDVDNLLLNEASDAGDDYKSGDSLDEEEREHAKENKFLERGETLTSDDENITNDSDYEKDSFVVSSDEEDNNLLSGSGDDLELSDNELSMNAKSKKKYNERKIKEQKQASREMFEARHKLNESNQESKKLKKKNRQRIDSTANSSNLDDNSDDDNFIPIKINRQRINSTVGSSSEEEIKGNKPRKAKRQRLESSTLDNNSSKLNTLDNSTDKTSPTKQKIHNNKNRLSESSILKENEITNICNQSTLDQKDPLNSSLFIKKELKTPQKELDISTINFTVREEPEVIQLEENMSMEKANITLDPLGEEMEEDNESSSDSNEIIQNYDSVLEALNNVKSNKKIKKIDISLNLDTKRKEKKSERQSLIDELNITQIKSRKPSKNSIKDKKTIEVKSKQDNKQKIESEANNDLYETSSDSIDLQQLFTEESDSDDNEQQTISKKKNSFSKEEDYIPLKKSEGKTNIDQDLGLFANNSQLEDKNYNSVGKKSNNDERKSKSSNDISVEVTPKDNVDCKNTSIDNKCVVEEIELNSDDEPPQEISNKDAVTNNLHIGITNDKKRKRKSSIGIVTQVESEIGNNISLTAGSLKKKRKFSNDEIDAKEPLTEISKDIEITVDADIKNPTNKKKQHKKKKNKTIEVQEQIQEKNCSNEIILTKEQKSNRKRKRDDEESKHVKIMKENSLDNVHIPRLPSTIISQLENVANKNKKVINTEKTSKIISTTKFAVEETKNMKSKPSHYLEDSIHIDTHEQLINKHKKHNNKPKLLPFLPTASTSACGFTTNFQVNVIPKEIKFVAQATDVSNFKNDYLYGKKIKRMSTYELYKKQRNVKLSKF